MSSDEEQRRADGALLPVHALTDLGRANLGSARVVRMVVSDSLADRAEEFQAQGMSRGQGGVMTETTGAGEGNSPFHTGSLGDILRHEE